MQSQASLSDLNCIAGRIFHSVLTMRFGVCVCVLSMQRKYDEHSNYLVDISVDISLAYEIFENYNFILMRFPGGAGYMC